MTAGVRAPAAGREGKPTAAEGYHTTEKREGKAW